ncbi:DUF58 domain-containing protein [Rheinheimera soli]|uniref:DUF58 domain-containing protein n=1 Tax=Rheinheimera soli TaxID=443616 RepID=UPI001E62922D|nr:DUF58 domain-containing protein [Rheinheimera soli]
MNTQLQLEQLATDGIHLDLPQLLAYQRHHALLDLAPKMAIQSKLAGSYLARSKGRGMEFDEVRHYQPGDDVRTIDWRVTARTGKVHTKLFREEKERPVFILTDLSESMRFGTKLLLKSVQAAHLAALLAWHVRETGDKLGGLVFSEQQLLELKPAARSQAVLRYLNALIKIQQNQGMAAESNINHALGLMRRLARPGALIFVISDFSALDAQGLRHLQAMRQHNEIRCVHITDPLDLQLPLSASGLAAVTDGVELKTLDLGSSTLKDSYRHQQHQWQQALQLNLKKLNCRYLEISAALPLIEQLNRSWPDGEH